MKREILINANPRETRVAIIEDDQLVELLVDRPEARRMVGDIYLGRVEAVLPVLEVVAHPAGACILQRQIGTAQNEDGVDAVLGHRHDARTVLAHK